MIVSQIESFNKTKATINKTRSQLPQDTKKELQDSHKVLQDIEEPFPRQGAGVKRQLGEASKTGLTLSKTEDWNLLLSFSSYFLSYHHKKEGIRRFPLKCKTQNPYL